MSVESVMLFKLSSTWKVGVQRTAYSSWRASYLLSQLMPEAGWANELGGSGTYWMNLLSEYPYPQEGTASKA